MENLKQLPEHGACFVCGSENSKSIGTTWFAEEDGTVVTEVTLTLEQQGPPGHAHGGASAALLDEAMGAAVWLAGERVLAVNLNVDFRRPLPLNVPVMVVAKIAERDGRKVFTRGEIRLPDGTAAVVGKGIFVKADQFFAENKEKMWWT